MDYITEYEYDLFIRPDTCNPRFRVWFNFTVENVKTEQVRANLESLMLIFTSTIFAYNILRPSFMCANFNLFSSLQRVIFNVVNFSKTKSLYRDGMSPMVKSSSRPKW